MEEQKYAIAIALVEQNDKRLMPLGGKTMPGVDTLNRGQGGKNSGCVFYFVCCSLRTRTLRELTKLNNYFIYV